MTQCIAINTVELAVFKIELDSLIKCKWTLCYDEVDYDIITNLEKNQLDMVTFVSLSYLGQIHKNLSEHRQLLLYLYFSQPHSSVAYAGKKNKEN